MDAGPEIEHHHHHTGHRLLDIVLGVSAILISLISLYLAIQHGKTMEHMVEATTWPYVEFANSDVGPDGGRSISIVIQNNGVGPARIESFELSYKGRPLRSGRDLLERCCTDAASPTPHYLSSSVLDRVLPAKDTLLLFRNHPKITTQQLDRLNAARRELRAKVCYCSVLEECWLRDSDKPKPERVKACPAVANPYND